MSQSFRKVVKGFSLVELAVVIVIIGVLAAFGVPRFIKSVERSKAAEAFAYLSAVRSAQERYHAREGIYSESLVTLDIKASTPKYFFVGGSATEGLAATAGGDLILAGGTSEGINDSWTLTATRMEPSAGYGKYTVTFTEDGYVSDATKSTIADAAHLDINPMGGSVSSGS